MYQGFPGIADEGRLRAFHTAGWSERAELAETFEDDRLRELGRRIFYLEHPETLTPQLRSGLDTWQQNRLNGRDGAEAGRTIKKAISELDDIATNKENASALQEIRQWLEAMRGA